MELQHFIMLIKHLCKVSSHNLYTSLERCHKYFICSINFLDIEKNYKVMGELDKLAKTVHDILECRIEAVLEDMSTTALCELPEDEAVTMEKFLEITSEVVANASKYLAKYVLVLLVLVLYLLVPLVLVLPSISASCITHRI